MLQASSIVGHTVQLSGSQMPLQNGSGSVTFTATAAGTAEITVTNAAGTKVMDTTVTGAVGANTWTWNGKDMQGNTQPDGSYKITVTGAGSGGAATALPFTVSGKVTGVVNSGGTLDVLLGSQAAPFSTVQSVSS